MESKIWIGSAENERLGPLWAAVSEKGLVGVYMRGSEAAVREHLPDAEVILDQERVADFLTQLVEYLDGRRRIFDLAIDWSVLPAFQQQVLQAVYAIPYGETRTYQDIADALGKPGAARAVGRANATNPMAPIIPCHRVVGADGRLHGYGGPGGVETKAWLLRLEGSRLL